MRIPVFSIRIYVSWGSYFGREQFIYPENIFCALFSDHGSPPRQSKVTAASIKAEMRAKRMSPVSGALKIYFSSYGAYHSVCQCGMI